MIVYHGSNMIVDRPIIINKNRFLDFGPGFYTTTNLSQAKEFSVKVVGRLKSGVPMVNYYEFDLETAFSSNELLRFNHVDNVWLDFVVENRQGLYSGKLYDFIYGAVANDDVFKTIALYIGGALSKENTIQALKVKELFNQLVFCNDKAISYLRYLKTEVTE